jgi:UDP-galactopyranose mutase
VYLIVGAGPAGAVMAERIASQRDRKVLVIDRREHLAGNLYDAIDDNGVMVHRYGPHIFHTNDREVWDYLSRFTRWHHYFHRAGAVVDGRIVPIPFNFDSLHALFPPHLAARLEQRLLANHAYGEHIPVLDLLETEDPDLRFLARYVFDNLFAGYTAKQWGRDAHTLDRSVTGRVPIRLSRDDRYFRDVYQGIPADGYTRMVENLLDHPNVELRLGVDYADLRGERFTKTIYTGKIDELFDHRFGPLPYRSLRFDYRTIDKPYFQPLAQVNYPQSYDFTRITEYKHFLDQQTPRSTIGIEYPLEHVPGENEPYYPIPDDASRAAYEQYRAEAAKRDDLILLGRLAEYRYYNMDQVVRRAFDVFEAEVA